ncbi:HlyD family type I secretion periplasmic adaptor subunit [Pseudochelatococcus sp. B33]
MEELPAKPGPAAGQPVRASEAVPRDYQIDGEAEETVSFPSANWRLPLLIGWAIVVFAIGGSFAWAALAPIDSAVVALGTVSVESNRKTVQHLEGGIVREIAVKDGDFVEEGQVLFRLDVTAGEAQLEVVRSQKAALLAEEARLLSERDLLDSIQFPQEVLDRQDDITVAQAIADQQRLFRERSAFVRAQTDVLHARMQQEKEELAGAEQERISGQKQIEWVDQELPGLRSLFEKGLVQWTRITALERQRAQLEGVTAKAAATHARLQHSIGQTQLEIAELMQKFQQEIAGEIAAVRRQIAEMTQKQKVAQDVLNRLAVVAPQSGVVQGLKVFTPGGVIRPGDPLLDIVPLNEEFVVRAQVSPLNMDVVSVGQRAELRFPAFHLPYVPTMFGVVRTLSYDRLLDEANSEPYFAAEVVADKSTLPPEIREKLRAGLPVDVVIVSGERTPLQYLLAPLTDRLRKGMREG